MSEAEGSLFQSKVELATNAIRALKPMPGTKTHILVDAWYTCRSVWHADLQRNFAITGGLRVNRWFRLPGPFHPGGYRKVRLNTYVNRIVSVHDPGMRHGRKSKAKRFDGHKAAVGVDSDSQLITVVEVLPGNASDNVGALELVSYLNVYGAQGDNKMSLVS